MSPRVSVILSTWNRGRHILPTIWSVLAQHVTDYELLVIGDHCTDDTAEQVAPFLSEQVRWLNLPERGGSQSFPNNAGIAIARGEFVAYIGHDDLWTADHLGLLVDALDGDQRAAFAVSGCLYHTPPGTGSYQITGFIDPDEPLRFFVPPSSFMHRKAAVTALGGWPRPDDIAGPVDEVLLSRARDAGVRFVPTNRLTVHKFAAGHRYLSYLDQTSDEQELLLRRFAEPGFDELTQHWLALSRQTNYFMINPLNDFSGQAKGAIAAATAKQKGSRMAPPTPLTSAVVIDQNAERRALDWREMVNGLPGWRWSGPNPRPKILIPFSGGPPNALTVIDIMHTDADVLHALRFAVDGREIAATIALRGASQSNRVFGRATLTLPLSARHTVLELLHPGSHDDNVGNFRGVAVGRIWLRPTQVA